MSTNNDLSPKSFRQNPTVFVEAIQMTNDNADHIVKWIGSSATELHRTKSFPNILIVTIYVPMHGGKLALRYKDFLVKYTDSNNKSSFLVLSPEQFHKRFDTNPTTTYNNENTMNPWGWGEKS